MFPSLPYAPLGLALVLLAAWLNALRLRKRNEALTRLAEERADALEGALRAAEAADAAKGDFLAVVSHELRTPVHAILGMTELMLAAPLAREQQDQARSVQRAARGLLGLVNDILDFSKMEAGKVSLRAVPFDLVELVEDLVDLHGVGARDKDLELILHWDAPEDRLLVGDPDRLRQVLMNLLGNALKFTARGHIRVKVEAPDGVNPLPLKLSVEDTGPGIHPDKREHLFEAFTQEDTSITRRFGGTGLGLAICKRLVEGMGGRIGFESRHGKGSVFWVELELPWAGEREEAPGPWEHPGFRVRVVEPHPEAREALAARLSRWGVPFEVGGEAWSGKPVQLVLAAEGVDLDVRHASIPVVAVCPIHLPRDPQALARLGFAGILRKPILTWELRELLDQAVSGGSWFGSEPAPASLPTPSSPGGMRVLVGEDNPLHQAVARGLLEGFGASVVLAGEGEAVLAEAAKGCFDVILLDGHMPGLDGLGTAQALRARKVATPILAMTAQALPGDRERFLAAGMDGFLTKPFGRAELAEALHRMVPGFSAAGVDLVELPDLNEGGPPAPFGRSSSPLVLPHVASGQSPATTSDFTGPLDQAALLAEARRSPEAIRELLALYCVHAPAQMAGLRRAVSGGSLPAVAEAAHALAGSAACLRAAELAERGRSLEARARAGDGPGVQAALPPLEAAYRAVWACLEPLAAALERP